MSHDRPLIYVEDVPQGPHGPLTPNQVERALGETAQHYDVVIADVAAPDLARLGRASIFVSTRIDTARMRQHAPGLKWAHLLNAGVERYLPLDWLPAGAILTNSSGIHAEMVGEYCAMALLMLNHNLPQYIDLQRLRSWKKLPARPIRGKQLLVIGTGGLGLAIARQARLLGMQVTGVNRSGTQHDAFDRVLPMAQLDQLLPAAEFIVLACPLTGETRYMFDARRFALCRPGAGLVNVGRGPLVDTQALIDALRAGRLSGAVLDVQEVEPVPADSPWWEVQHLVLTPHISCDTAEGYLDKGLAIFADNLKRYHQNQQASLLNQVSRDLGY